MTDNNKDMIKAILKSQRCQRNWDLSKEIPEEDLEVIKTAATQCPSKQNVQFYKPYFITNRDIIEKIHNASMLGGIIDQETKTKRFSTQSQLLANLLVVLVDETDSSQSDRSPITKSGLGIEYSDSDIESHVPFFGNDKEYMRSISKQDYIRDKNVAVGIAAGYMNLASALLGYQTGCCQCFDQLEVQNVLGIDNEVLLIMGIGYKDNNRPRREHHNHPGEFFVTNDKHIEATVIA